jgi:hypothetical protein
MRVRRGSGQSGQGAAQDCTRRCTAEAAARARAPARRREGQARRPGAPRPARRARWRRAPASRQSGGAAPASRQSGGAARRQRLHQEGEDQGQARADEVKKEQHKRLDSQLENTRKKPGVFYAQRGSTEEEARRAEKAATKKAKAKARRARRAHRAKVEAKRAVDTLRQEQRQRKFRTHVGCV